MKRLLLLALISFSTLSLFAQDAWDALRYSRVFFSGTSRFNGVAGSFGAVGADLSTLATNPAGIGMYKSFEVTVTPGVSLNSARSTYNGTEGKDYQANFAFSNLGFVYTLNTGQSQSNSGLRYVNVGFSMNRQNDYNGACYITGPNYSSSLLNVFADELNSSGIPSNMIRDTYPFDIGLAYDCALVYYDSAQGHYRSDMPYGGVTQEKSIITDGSLTEYDISAGANVANKVYFGLTLGIPSLRYYYSSAYSEFDSGDTIPWFESMIYHYGYSTVGVGVNVKAGVIYRPADWIRIGVAVHTPTWFTDMNDSWSSEMMAYYDSAIVATPQYSPVGYYDYRLTTPLRVIGSLAVFVGQRGFISGEYEYVNYRQARYYSDDGAFTEINKQISSDFRSPVTFRLGTEWRFGAFRVRGGFGYNGSPVKSGDIGTRYLATAGAGYFSQHFFADIAYQWAGSKNQYYLYQSPFNNPAEIWDQSHVATATLGFRL